MPRQTFIYEISNESDETNLRISIEPYASEFELLPRSTAQIQFPYVTLEPLVVHVGRNLQTVWVWETGTVRVVIDHNESTAFDVP